MFTTTPLALFETLTTGTPEQIQDSVQKELNEKAEAFLQEKRKQVVASLFAEPFQLGETVKRKRWDKTSIREALEAVALRDLNEDHSPAHEDIHKVAKKAGYTHSGKSYAFPASHPLAHEKASNYTHPNGSSIKVRGDGDWSVSDKTGRHSGIGNGHRELRAHLKDSQSDV